ncbi:MAG: DUF4279 domain-containing protein [Gammaproteobacteria bacterium]
MVLETFATLRIFSASICPEVITDRLGLESNTGYIRDPDARRRSKRETNYWGWCTKDELESTDNLVHIKAIIKRFKQKAVLLKELRSEECQMDICCYFVTSGQGGPYMDLSAMNALYKLGLEIWWDVYFGSEDES